MTGHSPGGDRRCPDDLVVRGRRAPLTELERHALATHLSQCAECRASSALAMLFEAIPDHQPGDGDLLARVAEKAIRAPRGAGRAPGLRVAVVVALMVLSATGATAAWMAYRETTTHGPAPSPTVPVTPGATHGRTPLAIPPTLPDDSPPRDTPKVSAEVPVVVETPRRRTAPTPTLAPPPSRELPESTAASVFADANAARRRGEIPKAIALYESLRERFPDSSQALLSFISVGDLLLGEGAADKAVAAYGAYLRGAPHGALTEEALYGRARGLRLAGRSAEERQTWQELLRRFPRSAYEPTASWRLRELAP